MALMVNHDVTGLRPIPGPCYFGMAPVVLGFGTQAGDFIDNPVENNAPCTVLQSGWDMFYTILLVDFLLFIGCRVSCEIDILVRNPNERIRTQPPTNLMSRLRC